MAERARDVIANSEVVERIRRALGARAGVAERQMFGGIAFLLNGNMCCGVTKNGKVVLRVGPEAYEDALRRPHVRECDFTGRTMRGMVMLDQDGTRKAAVLRPWVSRAAQYAGALPRKKPKATRGRRAKRSAASEQRPS